MNSRYAFGEFQARVGDSASGTSAPTHHAAFFIPPPQTGPLADPRLPAGPNFNYGHVCTPDYSSNTFGQAPYESQRFGSLPPAPPLTPVAQFQPPGSNVGGHFPRTSLNVNVNIPPPPVNVNIPPPPPVNVNMPPPVVVNANVPRLPSVNRNIPPPGFNPHVPPPAVFSPRLQPAAVDPSTRVSALARSPVILTSVAPPASSLPNWTHTADEQKFGIPQPLVPGFINSQRMPSDVTSDHGMAKSVSIVTHKLCQPSNQGAFSTNDGLLDLSSVYSSSARTYESSNTLASKCSSSDSVPVLLSSADHSADSSVEGSVVIAAFSEGTASSRCRRRASSRSSISVSCNYMLST